MPTNVALFPQAVEPTSQPAQTGFGNFLATGAFGSAGAPFVPAGGGSRQKDLKLSLPMDRLDDRRELLKGLDQMKGALDRSEIDGIDASRDKAFRAIPGGVSTALDLSKE